MQEDSRFKKDQKEDTKTSRTTFGKLRELITRQRLQMLTMHIEEEKLEQNIRKHMKTEESLQKTPDNTSENTFWKFQEKQRKNIEEQMTAMETKDIELVETENEVNT